MSKSANAGELNVAVCFKRMDRSVDKDGFPVEALHNVFGQDKSGKDIPVMCKWVNAHGSEVWTAMQLQLRDPVTITVRYSPLLDDAALEVYLKGDPKPYEVVSVDNVERRNEWLEIKAQRKVSAR